MVARGETEPPTRGFSVQIRKLARLKDVTSEARRVLAQSGRYSLLRCEWSRRETSDGDLKLRLFHERGFINYLQLKAIQYLLLLVARGGQLLD
jgi:hypothetical protein